MNEKIVELLKGYKERSHQKIIEFIGLMILKKIPPQIIIEILANILSTHIIIVGKFAYEMKEKGISKQELEEMLDELVPIGFKGKTNSTLAADAIKASLEELIIELDKAKKEQLH